jgi:hypothetical protein
MHESQERRAMVVMVANALGEEQIGMNHLVDQCVDHVCSGPKLEQGLTQSDTAHPSMSFVRTQTRTSILHIFEIVNVLDKDNSST